jgi:cystathionine beta-lyase/cystathionine gamma-synthase
VVVSQRDAPRSKEIYQKQDNKVGCIFSFYLKKELN